jgi:ATP-dependent Lon protease
MVAQALLSSQYANPVLMLDEIDKAENTDRHSTLNSLYTLLEPTSSERFRDEFVEIEFNAKHVTWIMTANDKSAIPAPLLDRMTVFDIKTPNESQFEQLAVSVYQECRNDCGAIHFPPSADAAVLRPLAGMSARAMRRTLESAMAAAFEVGRIALSTDDVCRALANAKQPARRIGFM